MGVELLLNFWGFNKWSNSRIGPTAATGSGSGAGARGGLNCKKPKNRGLRCAWAAAGGRPRLMVAIDRTAPGPRSPPGSARTVGTGLVLGGFQHLEARGEQEGHFFGSGG